MIGELVPATKTHALMMSRRVRAAEVREIAASHAVTPVKLLIEEVDRSASAWSWIVAGEVACMFGIVTPTLVSEEAYPWFFSTDLVDRYARQFARTCKELLPELLSRHPRLTGMVDARYALSVRWLEWLGATFDEPQPWGATGAPFRRFQIGV